ncbi:MAG: type II toxin-antitoxin system HicA family toxin [Comamonadaceae bacterium]|nr:type II toxin-antitoxin system HicA family toxin [Comamonadaceae bacterium]
MVTRQTGSHIRLTSGDNDQHHVTIPNHSQLRVGTPSAILADVSAHLKISRDQLVEKLFN